MITKWRYFDDDGVPMFYHEGIETTADNVVDALNAIENQFADLQVHIASLDLQLASRDALIERLVEAGSWLANLAMDYEVRASSVWKRSRDLAENDWDKGIAEYRAMEALPKEMR